MNQLLPAPKSIEKIGEVFVPKGWQWAYFPEQLTCGVQSILEIIEQKWFLCLSEQTAGDQDIEEGYIFFIGMKEKANNSLTEIVQEKHKIVGKADAYLLNVQNYGVFAWSATMDGLYYALQTLRQILNGSELFEMSIVDWPDLLYRGVHIDAKGERPGFEKLKNTISEWSHYKINTVLFEYEKHQKMD